MCKPFSESKCYLPAKEEKKCHLVEAWICYVFVACVRKKNAKINIFWKYFFSLYKFTCQKFEAFFLFNVSPNSLNCIYAHVVLLICVMELAFFEAILTGDMHHIEISSLKSLLKPFCFFFIAMCQRKRV